jgi:hypothetical protein
MVTLYPLSLSKKCRNAISQWYLQRAIRKNFGRLLFDRIHCPTMTAREYCVEPNGYRQYSQAYF